LPEAFSVGCFARAGLDDAPGHRKNDDDAGIPGYATRQSKCANFHPRHCERSEAIQSLRRAAQGLLRRFAPRNDGCRLLQLIR